MSAGRRAISVSGAVMRSARRSPFCSGTGGADTRGMAPAVRASWLVCYFVAHRLKQRVHAKRLVQGLSRAQEFGDT